MSGPHNVTIGVILLDHSDETMVAYVGLLPYMQASTLNTSLSLLFEATYLKTSL